MFRNLTNKPFNHSFYLLHLAFLAPLIVGLSGENGQRPYCSTDFVPESVLVDTCSAHRQRPCVSEMGLGSDLLRKSLFWRKDHVAADRRSSPKSDSEAAGTALSDEGEGEEQEKQSYQRMDVFYISHGSPMLPLQDCPARDFLRQWHEVLPQKPRAILVISAHWYTNEPSVNTVPNNSTIHDFYGFPPALYKLQYNAPGAPELARRVKQLLLESGVRTVHEDARRGLDHGAWIPLYLMYANADIPVCQLSVQLNRDGAYHYRLGEALAPLRDEGVLIIGSGSATHNLRSLRLDGSGPPSWALAFDDWLHESLASGRYDDVINFEEKAPNAKRVHPSPEHFYPLLVALGAAGSRCRAQRIHSSWMASSLSMANFAFK